MLMHVCWCCHIHLCVSVCFCFFVLFHMLLCVFVSSGHAFEKGWCVCVFVLLFPSTYLLSLIFHNISQRNELGGLGCREELQ